MERVGMMNNSSSNGQSLWHSSSSQSPKTPTTMLDRALSSRRPHSDADLSDSGESGTDESKTKRPHVYLLASNFVSRIGHQWLPCVIIALLFLVLLFLTSLAFHSSSFVCVSRFDPAARIGFFGFDGLESDFGALGVPWLEEVFEVVIASLSKHGKEVEWTSKDLLKALEEFVPIYETRPIKNNMHGMGFDHSFGLWFMARWLKPELMIESGAFKGHSTWVMRQAMPDTPIISLTPRHPEKYLKKGPAYVDGNCTYFAGKDFVDFGSVDWKNVLKKHGVKDLNRVLVFFDDHQNELKRIKQAQKAGFQHLIFEDNYDTGTGDHYSLRQICDQSYIKGGGHSCFKDSDEARIRSNRKKFWEKAVDTEELCGPGETWWGVRGEMRDDFNHSNTQISYNQHFQNSRYVESILDVYWELPPVAGPSLTHQSRYDPARSTPPVVADGRRRLFQRIGLGKKTLSGSFSTHSVYSKPNDFIEEGSVTQVKGGKAIVPNVIRVVELARQRFVERLMVKTLVVREHDPQGRDVEIFRRHHYRSEKVGPVVKGTLGSKLVDGLNMREEEDYKIVKTRFSAFFGTHLHSFLQTSGITKLVIAGVQTPNCIRQTVFDAVELDYPDVTVIVDATAAATPEIHTANILDMRNIGVKTPTLHEWSEEFA
ncbi:hypothetical protein YC2023_067697 [Brassica napus]